MRVAVAVDGSEHALRAATHAVSIAKHIPNASLEVIFVAHFREVKDKDLVTKGDDRLASVREEKVNPALDIVEQNGMHAKVTILKGNPHETMIEYVNESAIDHLVLGSRGLNTFQEMILGSVSQQAIKHVKCPVTIVR